MLDTARGMLGTHLEDVAARDGEAQDEEDQLYNAPAVLDTPSVVFDTLSGVLDTPSVVFETP